LRPFWSDNKIDKLFVVTIGYDWFQVIGSDKARQAMQRLPAMKSVA
jgi:hypothetical protein